MHQGPGASSYASAHICIDRGTGVNYPKLGKNEILGGNEDRRSATSLASTDRRSVFSFCRLRSVGSELPDRGFLYLPLAAACSGQAGTTILPLCPTPASVLSAALRQPGGLTPSPDPALQRSAQPISEAAGPGRHPAV